MALDNLRILRLEAENVKRLTAVEITPEGELVVIGGRNGQGKTSVLDSILWALGGEKPIQWKPIRAGEAEAHIALDLGNDEGLQLKVLRTFRAKDDGDFTTKLKVVNAEGFRPDGEQTLLNTIVGALSFDPSAFIRSKPPEQVAFLKALVPGDFAGIARRRKEAFEARAEFNREAKRLKAAAESIPAEELAARIDDAPILDAIHSAVSVANDHHAEVAKREEKARAIASAREEEAESLEEVRQLEARIAICKSSASEWAQRAHKWEAELKEAPPLAPLPDTSALSRQLDEARRHNRLVDRQEERQRLAAEAAEAEALAERQSVLIDGCDAQVIELIESADLPVRGLSFNDEGVQLRGVPFEQASDAEQLRAALALAMAANPRLRVIRIRDGSLLDSDAMEVIREVAAEEGFQIWVERVGTGDADAIIIEDGSVKNA